MFPGYSEHPMLQHQASMIRGLQERINAQAVTLARMDDLQARVNAQSEETDHLHEVIARLNQKDTEKEKKMNDMKAQLDQLHSSLRNTHASSSSSSVASDGSPSAASNERSNSQEESDRLLNEQDEVVHAQVLPGSVASNPGHAFDPSRSECMEFWLRIRRRDPRCSPALLIVLLTLAGPIFVFSISTSSSPQESKFLFWFLFFCQVVLSGMCSFLLVVTDANSISSMLAQRSAVKSYFAALLIMALCVVVPCVIVTNASLHRERYDDFLNNQNTATSAVSKPPNLAVTALAFFSPIVCGLILVFPLRSPDQRDLVWTCSGGIHHCVHHSIIRVGVILGWISIIIYLTRINGIALMLGVISLLLSFIFVLLFATNGKIMRSDATASVRFGYEFAGLYFLLFGLLVSSSVDAGVLEM